MNDGEIDDLLLDIDGDSEDIIIPEESKEKAKKKSEINDFGKLDTSATDILNFDSVDDEKALDDYNDSDTEPFVDTRADEFGKNKIETDKEIVREELEKEEYKKIDYIVSGTRSWNTREPYIIPFNERKLKSDFRDLSKTFYFIEEFGKNSNIQGEMKRAMFKFIRGSIKSVKEKYSEYLYKLIFIQTNEIGQNFGFVNEKLNLFLFHLGVLTVYRILVNHFQKTKTGYCYKVLDENRVMKYLPYEFIKEITLQWYNDNINRNDLPFDAIFEYNEIKRVISTEYKLDFAKSRNKLDNAMTELKLNQDIKLDRDEYYKSKWDEWFGKTNILIYNRFLERTVFKIAR